MTKTEKTILRPPLRALPAAAGPLATWAPLFLLPLLAAPAFGRAPAWLSMWALAAAIFAGVKWSSWWSRPELRASTPPRRALAYLLCWPGMDPARFCSPLLPARPRLTEWLAAFAKTAFGAAMLWAVTPRVPLPLAGWSGMIGLIFLLHFGSFHLLSLAYRHAGVPAEPLMHRPAAAPSLADFWGRRWNRGFRDWAHRLLFRPAEAKFGPVAAHGWVFLVSGALHEAVISLPAGGGYGGPSGYFLLQGAGIWLERTPMGRRLGLRRGWRGHLWTLAVTALPAYWLFHPRFVARVMLPFLEAIGAR